MSTSPVSPLRRKVTSTVVTETLPTGTQMDAHPTEFYDGDPWEVLARIHSEIEKKIPWETHMARVYRVTDRGDSESVPENNKFMEPFNVDSLRERFGGGNFKIWIYGPPNCSKLVVRPFIVKLEGAARAGNPSGYNGTVATDGSNAVAMTALTMMNNPQIMQMQLEMMKSATLSAIEIIKSQMPVAQDPLATLRNAKEILGGGSAEHGLLDTLRVLKELGLVGSPEKKGIDEILSLISTLKTSGLITSGVPKADLASTFASNLPMLADRLVTGFQEIRLKTEAEERVMRMQRGEIHPGDPNVITMPGNQPPPPAAPAAAAPQSLDPQMVQAILIRDRVERLVAGIRQPNSTGEDMYDYLLNAWPEVLAELSKFSKEQLLIFFKSREMQMQQLGCDLLAEVGDDPRLPKMIEEFLKIAKENPATSEAPASTVATAGAI